jgi:hypothetical protein
MRFHQQIFQMSQPLFKLKYHKNIKYLFLLILSISTLTSCVNDTEDFTQNAEGPNVAGFTNARENVSNISDGSEYTFELNESGSNCNGFLTNYCNLCSNCCFYSYWRCSL